MRCAVTLRREGRGVIATCADFPACDGRGATAAEAMARLREAVLFWLEACPCDQTAEPGLVLDVVRDDSDRSSSPARTVRDP
jgi:predicted RNase H-like HicB family nuclease